MDNFMHSVGSLFEGRQERRQRGRRRRGDTSQEEHQNDGQQQQQQANPFGNPFQQMTESFQQAFSSPSAPVQTAPPPSQKKAPPASVAALRKLPTIVVRPQDLVDPLNRECCICFEEHPLGSKALRLPCAHIFHPGCIMEWLGNKNNACPLCRYELPTDDPWYEQHVRIPHMKNRKPRFAPHELKRMSIRDLKELCVKLHLLQKGQSVVEKGDLLQLLENSGKVDIISTPDPVEYPLTVLQHMSIKQLKQCMNEDAGVFFDPRDVIEKNDMIQIFINSGRLILLPEKEDDDDDDDSIEEEDDDRKMPAKPLTKRTATHNNNINNVEVETVESDDEGSGKMKTTPGDSSTHHQQLQPQENEPFMDYNTDHQDPPVSTTTANSSAIGNTDPPESTTTVSSSANGNGGRNTHSEKDKNEEEEHVDNDKDETVIGTENDGHDGHNGHNDDPMEGVETFEESTFPSVNQPTSEGTSTDDTNTETTPAAAAAAAAASHSNDDDHHNNYTANHQNHYPSQQQRHAQYESRSISQLKAEARRLNVDLSKCIERSEMIDQLLQATSETTTTLPQSSGDYQDNETTTAMIVHELSQWNASQLVALIQQHCPTIRLEGHETESELLFHIVETSKNQPDVQNKLVKLCNFTNMSISELRQYATHHHIDLSQCIERSEMIQTLLLLSL